MPNGVTPQEEYKAFRAWAQGEYGRWAVFSQVEFTIREYRTSPAYERWISLDKPGFEAPVPPQPWELREKLGEVPLYVDEYPEPPYALVEGLEWVKQVKTDPTRIEWVSQEVGEEEKEPWEVGGYGSEQDWRVIMGLELTAAQEAEQEATRWWREQQVAKWEEEAQSQAEYREWQMSDATLARGQPQRERELTDRLRLQQELAQLGGPADWIKRWQMVHGVIPRAEAAHLRERSQALLLEAQDLTGAERTMKEMQSENLVIAARRLRVKAKEMQEPLTPEWLPDFAETQVAGEPITKARTTTPSGQQWISTPQSVRQGLRGYTEWAGFSPTPDILDQMAMMQTRTPQGAGRTRWKPAQQRA